MPTTTDTTAPEIDPNDPPSDVTELYVCGTSTQRRYHVDPDCNRLTGEVHSRQVEIAASWYPACRYCVTGEFPLEAEQDSSGPPEGSEQPTCSDCNLWMGWVDTDDEEPHSGYWKCTVCGQ